MSSRVACTTQKNKKSGTSLLFCAIIIEISYKLSSSAICSRYHSVCSRVKLVNKIQPFCQCNIRAKFHWQLTFSRYNHNDETHPRSISPGCLLKTTNLTAVFALWHMPSWQAQLLDSVSSSLLWEFRSALLQYTTNNFSLVLAIALSVPTILEAFSVIWINHLLHSQEYCPETIKLFITVDDHHHRFWWRSLHDGHCVVVVASADDAEAARRPPGIAAPVPPSLQHHDDSLQQFLQLCGSQGA